MVSLLGVRFTVQIQQYSVLPTTLEAQVQTICLKTFSFYLVLFILCIRCSKVQMSKSVAACDQDGPTTTTEQKHRDQTKRREDTISRKNQMRPRLTSANVWRRRQPAHEFICDVWRRNGHGLGCTAASGTASLIVIDDISHDGSSRTNSEVDTNILSDNLQRNT